MVNIPGLDKLPNVNEITDKVGEKVNFPASKNDILDAVDKIPQLPDQAKDFLSDKLPDKEYSSVDDVKSTIGL